MISGISKRKILLTLGGAIVIGVASFEVTLYTYSTLFKQNFQSAFHKEFQQQLNDTSQRIITLSSDLSICDKDAIVRLRDEEFFDLNSRLIGWLEDNRQACTSRPGYSHVMIDKPNILNRYIYEEDMELDIISLLNGRSQLMLAKKIGDKRWFSLLEPWTLYFSAHECQNCASVSIGKQPGHPVGFYLGDIPVSFKFNIKTIHTFYAKHAFIWSVVSIFFYIFAFGYISIWRTNQHQSPKNRLKLAVHNHEIVPHFQLIVDSRDNKRQHCEVLARWTHGQGIMMPNVFIPLAESTGYIDLITISLLNQTRKMVKDNNTICQSIIFSFNLTPSQLDRPEFVQELLDFCHPSPPFKLAFEITEREPFKDPKQARLIMDKFSQLGIIFELDDAGTGYGSFSYIQELGFDILKIDKMFVDTIMSDNIKINVLDGIIEFGHTANITMIAEGVEYEKQADYLRKKGVFLHQGYYYSKPLNQKAFLNNLSTTELVN